MPDSKRSSSRRRRLLQILTAVVATLLALGLAEVGLRAGETLGAGRWFGVADYGDVWGDGDLGPGGFLREGFSGRVRDGFGGTVRWTNNAAGFRREEEVSPERAPGSSRILSLGDSFAAGYRVDQEKTYSWLLEDHLESADRWSRVEVLVAAIEAPSIGLRYLQAEGVRWKPDVVLLGLTLGNDVAQSYVTLDPRGDFRLDERGSLTPIEPNPNEDKASLRADLRRWTLPPRCFDADVASPPDRRTKRPARTGLHIVDRISEVATERRLREEPQAVASLWGRYTSPLLFDNHGLGIYLEPAPPQIRTAYDRLFSILRRYQEVTAAHGIRLAVALFPQRFQVQDRDWEATIEAYGLSPDCFDRMAPNRRIARFCRHRGILCLDPTSEMRRTFEATQRSLYLPRGDMHWNARGHRAVYEAIRDPLSTWMETRVDPRVDPSR